MVSSYEGLSTGEVKAAGYKGLNYDFDYVILGDSRDLAWKGENDDDNLAWVGIMGFVYSR
jgi:hypothetical protein